MNNKLKEIREARGVSKLELARMSGVTRQTIAKIEDKADAVVNTSTLKKLANALDVTVSDLFLT